MAHDDTDLTPEPVPGGPSARGLDPRVDPGKTDPDTEPHAASPTAYLLAELARYGYRPGADEPDPRPLPEPEAAQVQLNAAVAALSALLTGTRLEDDLADKARKLGIPVWRFDVWRFDQPDPKVEAEGGAVWAPSTTLT
ncbi:MAG: hypothetical protein ACREE2_20895 [Stellaceae bacterium]